MVERPILMSAPMVRATLRAVDPKTQTRRAIKPEVTDTIDPVLIGDIWQWATLESRRHCPYGLPGDRLWVREAWRTAIGLDDLSPTSIAEKCLDAGYSSPWTALQFEADGARNGSWTSFRPALPGRLRAGMHMPRWASRITLEVTGVRVERLQDISEADAKAEGIVALPGGGFGLPDGSHYHAASARISYWSLWDAINGAGATDLDPWCWCVSFRRIEPATNLPTGESPPRGAT